MLTTIDRIQIAVQDAAEAARGWIDLVDAVHVRDDRVRCLGARRSVLQVGRSEVEFLEADGAGPVADSLAEKGRPHLFAAGASTPDVSQLVAHFDRLNVTYEREGDQTHALIQTDDQNDLRFVISPEVEREPVGLIDRLYEVTILIDDFQPMVDLVTQLFQLNSDHYCRITSSVFKYDGYLTLFHPDRLDRFEVIHPTSSETTMGRYHARVGRCFYMAYAETGEILQIEQRAKERGVGITVERPEGRPESAMADSIWLHPPALGGVMLGISRPTQAWSWSGRPDRVEAI